MPTVFSGENARIRCQEVRRDDTDIVPTLRKAIAARLGEQRFSAWFGSGTRLSLKDDTLRIEGSNRFVVEWLQQNFRQPLEEAALEVTARPVSLEFSVLPPSECHDAILRAASKGAGGVPYSGSEGPRRPKNGEAGGTISRRPSADSGMTFDSFVVGPCNRLARVSAELVVESPGHFSPFVICGPTSCGKTHLLRAVAHAARRAKHSVVFCTAEQFTSAYVQAIHGNGLPSFRGQYRAVDFFLLDDLQFLQGKRATAVEFLYTIDSLQSDGKQVVLAADRRPEALCEIGPELVARLQGGNVCEIAPAGYQTRLEIVTKMARRLEMNVPAEVLRYVASRLTGHVRELSGALCRLQATHRAVEKPIDLSMAEESLADLVFQNSRSIGLDDIERAVREVVGLDGESLQTPKKAKRLNYPRMLAMWLARKHTRIALAEIGRFFGGRTHSTVISAQKQVERWLASENPVLLANGDWRVKDAIDKVESLLSVN